jgi:DNA-binding transcriptional ArsR family regulator
MSRPISTESAFRAAAHSHRRRIVDLLIHRDLTPGEMVQSLGGTRPALSQHLRVLRDCGIIAFQQRGRSVVYRLNRQSLRGVAAWAGRAVAPAPSRRAPS